MESTARAAHEHGYHVVLATDAMADRDPTCTHSVQRIFPRLGETATTGDILAMLDKTGPGSSGRLTGPPHGRRATPQ